MQDNRQGDQTAGRPVAGVLRPRPVPRPVPRRAPVAAQGRVSRPERVDAVQVVHGQRHGDGKGKLRRSRTGSPCGRRRRRTRRSAAGTRRCLPASPPHRPRRATRCAGVRPPSCSPSAMYSRLNVLTPDAGCSAQGRNFSLASAAIAQSRSLRSPGSRLAGVVLTRCFLLCSLPSIVLWLPDRTYGSRAAFVTRCMWLRVFLCCVRRVWQPLSHV